MHIYTITFLRILRHEPFYVNYIDGGIKIYNLTLLFLLLLIWFYRRTDTARSFGHFDITSEEGPMHFAVHRITTRLHGSFNLAAKHTHLRNQMTV